MKFEDTLVAAAFFACLTSNVAARAADQQTQALISAYNASKYNRAELLGERVVAKHPTDYTAHYYLANTYVLLHKNEQAIGEYRLCLNSGMHGPLKKYSSTALERLLKQKEQALMAASKNSENPGVKEIKEFKKKLRLEATQEQEKVRAEWQDAIATFERNNRGRNFGYGRGFGYGRRDSGYDERFRINDYYSKKLADLKSYEESMMSQANCGKGRIRIQPGLSSSKVKNYINYGDESEAVEIPVDNPLQAVAKSLSDVAPKSPKSAPKPKSSRPPKHTSDKAAPPKAKPLTTTGPNLSSSVSAPNPSSSPIQPSPPPHSTSFKAEP